MHLLEPGRSYVTLDDMNLRALAKSDPPLLLQRFPPPVLIDEVQYAPELFPAIKRVVDRHAIPGGVWLTGSQSFPLMQVILTDPKGNVMVARRQENDLDLGAPTWFVHLLPIKADPGIAHVQDGWKQFGSVSLASHSKFAYRDLWQGTVELSGNFLLGGILAGILGTLLVRVITRPLNAVVEQAHAITERRFITVATPKVPELRSVVSVMNDMVARVKQMFADEAARLDAMRKQLAYDAVSNLPNRDYFMGRLREALDNDDAAPNGVLVRPGGARAARL